MQSSLILSYKKECPTGEVKETKLQSRIIPWLLLYNNYMFITTILRTLRCRVIFLYSNSLYREFYGLKHVIDHSPYYTVGIHFLVMTLVAELPVVYLSLRKNSADKKVLAVTAVAINMITTFAVARIEGLSVRGSTLKINK